MCHWSFISGSFGTDGGELFPRLSSEGGGLEREPEIPREAGDRGVVEIVLRVDDDLPGDVVRRGVELHPLGHRLVRGGGGLAQITGRASGARLFGGGVAAQKGARGE
jgi:hypothetical protein